MFNLSMCNYSITGQVFNLTLLPVGHLRLYDSNGRLGDFEEADCPCVISLERTTILSIEANASEFKGFIM